MELYFVRHGQSENNVLWTRTRSSKGRTEDPELTAVGWEQARIVAGFLSRAEMSGPGDDLQNVRGFGITHLYCSPMVRAVATGSAIAQALDLPLVAWKDLHETGGIYLEDEESGERRGLPGKSRAFFRQHYPRLSLPDTLGDGGWWDRPFEERDERPPRARRVLAELIRRHVPSDDRVAWVSHGGFYYHFMMALLDLPALDGVRFQLNNTGITRIGFRDEYTAVRYMNRVDFLPRDLIT